MSVTAVITHISRTSLHDGPGGRTTVFLKGCPLRCCWCHNPEGLLPRPQLMVKTAMCEGCGRCKARCRQHAIEIVDGRAKINPERCVFCGYCARVCPQFCIKVV